MKTDSTLTKRQITNIRRKLLAKANADHAQHPQYLGYWDTWSVVRITRDVVLPKSGLVFKEGQYAIADLSSAPKIALTPGFILVYSEISQVSTSIQASLIERILPAPSKTTD